MQEGNDCLFVLPGIFDIAQAMSCIGENLHRNRGAAGDGDFLAHGPGNQSVVLPMDKQDGNLGMAYGILGGAICQAEPAPESGGQMEQGTEEHHGVVSVLADLFDDGCGGRVGGVCNDGTDRSGQIQFRSHQYRSCAHGQTRKDNGGIGESVSCIICPGQAIHPFVDTEGDDCAIAIAVGTLVDDQRVVTQFPGQGMAAAAIPVRVTPVAVANNLDGCTVVQMIIPAMKFQTVMGPDADGFIRVLLHNMGHPVDMLPDCIVLGAVYFHIGSGMRIWVREKNLPVDVVRNGENHNRKDKTYR